MWQQRQQHWAAAAAAGLQHQQHQSNSTEQQQQSCDVPSCPALSDSVLEATQGAAALMETSRTTVIGSSIRQHDLRQQCYSYTVPSSRDLFSHSRKLFAFMD